MTNERAQTRRRLTSMSLSRRTLEPAATTSSSEFLRHPETNAATNEAKPYHEIIFPCALEARHAFADQAWVDEEAGDSGNRMMLVGIESVS
jgi:hypothetical protein